MGIIKRKPNYKETIHQIEIAKLRRANIKQDDDAASQASRASKASKLSQVNLNKRKAIREAGDMGLFEAALDDERLMENILYEDNTDGDPIEKNEGFTNYPLDPVIFG